VARSYRGGSGLYAGAAPGRTQSDSAIYDEPQAGGAFAKLTELFAQTLN
jgi:hypothetical protein